MRNKKVRQRIYKDKLLLISVLILFGSLPGCFKDAGVEAAKVIENVIPKLTEESEQWREEWMKTREELPEDVRKQFDLAFENALSAAGAEFKCTTDFIRSRLKMELEIVVAKILNKVPSPQFPEICRIFPDGVIDLDSDSRPKSQDWIKFAGYDFVDSNRRLNVKALLELTDGNTLDVTQCCVDSPTNYLLTVDFDEIEFANNHRRLVLSTNSGEELGRSVAISHAPPPEPQPVLTTYEVVLKTGCRDSAGTDARVFIIVRGSKGETQETRLDLPNHDDRERCDVDTYRITAQDDLGDLFEVRIRHDNTKNKPGWYLEEVTVRNLVTNATWSFPCQRWLATSTGDKQISRIIPLGGPCQ